MLKVDKIIELNKKFGGSVLEKGNLDFDIDQANHEKNIYKSNAYVIRAMTQGHAFFDGNKRTALTIIARRFSKEGIKCNKEKLANGLVLFAKKKISINKIERNLKRWCKKY
jgi:prophage maintenance system killer protein